MCGRFAMPWDPEQVADMLGLDADGLARSVTPSYNIAPGMTISRHQPHGGRPKPAFGRPVESDPLMERHRSAPVSHVQRARRIGGRQADVSRRRAHGPASWSRCSATTNGTPAMSRTGSTCRTIAPLLAAGLLSIWHGIPTCTILTPSRGGAVRPRARPHARHHPARPLVPVAHPPGGHARHAPRRGPIGAARPSVCSTRIRSRPCMATAPGSSNPVAPAPEQGLLFD